MALYRDSISQSSTPSRSRTPAVTKTSTATLLESFDVLSPLHELLSRLINSEFPTLDVTQDQPLLPQHFASEASIVRERIKKAVDMVHSLPNMNKTVTEQKSEIQQLKERIEQQKEVLRLLTG